MSNKGADIVRDDLSGDEEAALRALDRLAKIWPDTLMLFSRSGMLVVQENPYDAENLIDIAYVSGIPNDGGDPP